MDIVAEDITHPPSFPSSPSAPAEATTTEAEMWQQLLGPIDKLLGVAGVENSEGHPPGPPEGPEEEMRRAARLQDDDLDEHDTAADTEDELASDRSFIQALEAQLNGRNSGSKAASSKAEAVSSPQAVVEEEHHEYSYQRTEKSTVNFAEVIRTVKRPAQSVASVDIRRTDPMHGLPFDAPFDDRASSASMQFQEALRAAKLGREQLEEFKKRARRDDLLALNPPTNKTRPFTHHPADFPDHVSAVSSPKLDPQPRPVTIAAPALDTRALEKGSAALPMAPRPARRPLTSGGGDRDRDMSARAAVFPDGEVYSSAAVRSRMGNVQERFRSIMQRIDRTIAETRSVVEDPKI
mmetsp:Transcript_26679/g.66886  ORF Transcript_26679/g.66886 Transcript_26679/m.66886 type:complete len:351 (+) Transcript_26679:36-1088(+)